MVSVKISSSSRENQSTNTGGYYTPAALLVGGRGLKDGSHGHSRVAVPHQQSTVAGTRGRPLSAFILKCFMWGFDIYPAHEVKTFPAVFQSGVKLSCFVSYSRFRKWFFTGIVMKQSSSTCFLYSLLLYLLLLFVCSVDIYIWDKHNEIYCYKDEGRLNRSSATVKFITISCFHMYRTGGALIVLDEILCTRYISLCSPLEKTFAGCGPWKL